MTDSQKGQAAAAMYAGQPFLLTVRAWLRIPDDRKRWRWRTGRLLITEISVSWRPTGRPGHPVILTGAGLVSRRQYDPLYDAWLPGMNVMIMVIDAGGRRLELAVHPENAEHALHWLTQGPARLLAPGSMIWVDNPQHVREIHPDHEKAHLGGREDVPHGASVTHVSQG
jgi:hypothetical protein